MFDLYFSEEIFFC